MCVGVWCMYVIGEAKLFLNSCICCIWRLASYLHVAAAAAFRDDDHNDDEHNDDGVITS